MYYCNVEKYILGSTCIGGVHFLFCVQVTLVPFTQYESETEYSATEPTEFPDEVIVRSPDTQVHCPADSLQPGLQTSVREVSEGSRPFSMGHPVESVGRSSGEM